MNRLARTRGIINMVAGMCKPYHVAIIGVVLILVALVLAALRQQAPMRPALFDHVLPLHGSMLQKSWLCLTTGELVSKQRVFAENLPCIAVGRTDHVRVSSGLISKYFRSEWALAVKLRVANVDLRQVTAGGDGRSLTDYWNDADDRQWPDIGERKTSLYEMTVEPQRWGDPVLFRTFDGTTGVLHVSDAVKRTVRIRGRHVDSTSSTQPAEDGARDAPLFIADLDNGVTVQVVGVAPNPSADKAWWQPNGWPLRRAPYQNTRSPRRTYKDRVAREIAFRIIDNGNDMHRLRWGCEENRGSVSVRPMDEFGNSLWDVKGDGYLFDAERTTTTMKIAVASGPWTTVVQTREGDQRWHVDGMLVGFSQLRSDRGEALIDLTLSEKWHRYCTQTVAVDRFGEVHVGSDSYVSNEHVGTSTLTNYEVQFRDLRLSDVSEFQFQVAPYHPARFRNISLRAGQKTDVVIVVDEPVFPADLEAVELTETKPGS